LLFDSPQEEHHASKIRRYIITGVAAVVLAFLSLWYWPGNLRYYKEKDTVRQFLGAVTEGNMQQAYQIWKPSPSYSFKDFLEDWGPDGYYGPVRSYHIERETRRSGGSNGLDVIVEVSPSKPFPSDDDAAGQSKIKEIDLWVQFSDHSMSFPPPSL
jgi:hypothetical protein